MGEKAHTTREPDRKFRRDTSDVMIAGMCAGTGNLLAVDPTIVRMFAVVATLFSFGTGLVLYLVGWLLVLEE